MSELPKVDVLSASIKTILGERKEAEIMVREGLVVEVNGDGSLKVYNEGRAYGLDELPYELESEIIAAAKVHTEIIIGLERDKYLDPDQNPMIRKEDT